MTAYGIDLGTTYSCIAKVDGDRQAVVLKNNLGKEVTPSVVYFEDKDLPVVGFKAKSSLEEHPDLVRSLIKREMGTAKRWTYHGQEYGPEEVSALILRKLAEAADEEPGDEGTEVVISVPAYFGIAEQEATRQAGVMAGLKVLGLIPEPVAAALYYHSTRQFDRPRNVFVYDLGGGTFDTTVIRLSASEVRVVCTDGDRKLGGADWDKKVRDFLLAKFRREYPDIDPDADDRERQLFALNIEAARKALSLQKSRPVTMIFGGESMRVELTRDELEAITRVELNRTMEITDRTVAAAAQLGVTSFDDVLLVGGMSQMPTIQDKLTERFKLEPKVFEPELAVAKGAAIYAALFGQVDIITAPKVTNVLPRALGLKVIDRSDPLYKTDRDKARRMIVHLLPANRSIPANSGPQTFATAFDDQNSVRLEVYEQAGATPSPDLEHNVRVAECRLANLPSGSAGREFQVTFLVTEDRRLRVHAFEAESGQEVSVEVQVGRHVIGD